jgi:hypothetical protein
MNINTISIQTGAELEKYLNNRPYDVRKDGLEGKVVELLTFDTDIILTFEQTDMSYVNLQTALGDGLEHTKTTEIVVKDTTVIFITEATCVISIFDPTANAYPLFESVFNGLQTDPTKSGNDFLLGGKKVMGVANYITDSWAAVLQMRPLDIDTDKYVDLPDSKFEGKAHDHTEKRIGSISGVLSDEITSADIEDQLISVFKENKYV